MTDQTVSVPVAELIALRDDVTNWESVAPLAAVLARIPAPPKVGDTLTAEQIKALPVGALVVDAQEDPWMVRPYEKVLWYGDSDTLDNRQTPKAAWGPYTLVYLPEGK